MDIFVSHSTKDSATAAATCAALEKSGFRCWIAPRDIQPGTDWGAAIIEGIESSRLLVLVLTSHSNVSQQVLREVERAVAKGLPIIPLRVEDVQPTKGLEFFISSQHWLDATVPPLERHLARLAESAQALLGREKTAGPPTPPGAAQKGESPSWKMRMPLVAAVALAAAALLFIPAAWLAGQYFLTSQPPEPAPSVQAPAADSPSQPAPHDPLFAQTVAARFERWDDNGDGQLAGIELRRFLTNWESARDEPAAFLRRHDGNDDGALSQEEVLQVGQHMVGQRDGDGDGRYTLAEALAANRRDGKVTPQTVAKFFRADDANDDGFVTVLEMERSIVSKLRAD